jgi:hypothetical protein
MTVDELIAAIKNKQPPAPRSALYVCCLVLSGASVSAQSADGPLSLAQGVYHLEGRCVSMVANSKDDTSRCLGRASIVTKNPARPTFVFSRTDGLWVFIASANPVYSNEGKTATFPISKLIDGATTPYRALELPGECVLNAASHPTLSCTIELQGGKNVHAIFDGSGTWSFSRT